MPQDKRTELKEKEKIDNYSKLRQEKKKIWNLSQIVVIPVVIGALGVTSKKIERLAGEVKGKEQHRVFAKSSISWNFKDCKARPRDLRLLGTTCSLGNILNRDKHNNNNNNNSNNNRPISSTNIAK